MVEIVRHIKPVIGRVERCVGKLSYGRKASCDGLCVIWTQHRAQHGILMNQDLLEEIKALKRIAQLSPSISSSTKAKKKVFTLDNKYFVRTVMSALVLSIIFFLWAKSKQ